MAPPRGVGPRSRAMTAAPSANTPQAEARRGVRVGQGLQKARRTQRRLAGLLDGFVQQEQHSAPICGPSGCLDERNRRLDEQVVRGPSPRPTTDRVQHQEMADNSGTAPPHSVSSRAAPQPTPSRGPAERIAWRRRARTPGCRDHRQARDVLRWFAHSDPLSLTPGSG